MGKRIAGFTLIELVITVAIAGILLAVAVPSYRQYIVRSYLGESFDSLSAYRVRMEQAYLDNGNYGVNGACAVALPASPNFNYGCTLTNGGQGFTATATGNAVNALTGYSFSINDTGARATTAFPSAAVPAACWLTRVGGC